jgi:glycosyltransferase involved in cell wall biosynthesis
MAFRSRKINLLFIIDLLIGLGGGTETHLANYLFAMNRDKFNATVCTFHTDHGKNFQKIQNSGIDVVHIPVRKTYGLTALLRFFSFYHLIHKKKIDIVQTFLFKSDTYGVLCSKLSGVKHIISSKRDINNLKKPRQLLLNRICNPFINHFIVNCVAVREAVAATENISSKKMTLIYNGVDTDRFKPQDQLETRAMMESLGINKGSFVIGSVAIFRPEKAYHIFFDGIEKIQPMIKNLAVLVIGKGPLKQMYESYCRDKGMTYITFVGSTAAMEKYMNCMDIVCLVPNKNEGFSNAIIEAMAVGKPVIATDIGGNAESVIDGETGIVIPPNDPSSFADALWRLYQDNQLRTQMGINGRRRVLKYFTLPQMADKMETLYDQLYSSRQ